MTNTSLAILNDPIKARFPYCQLNDCAIVHALPKQCPFRARHPSETLTAMRDSAWRAMGDDDEDATEMMDVYESCSDCVSKIAGHRTIKRLRREAGLVQ